MLQSLHIENVAVIKSADIDFQRGFTVFSGETGAGKSVIIDSIKLLLGDKFDRELIRHGESFAMVSGFFSEISDIATSDLLSHGVSLDEDGGMLVQRTVFSDGKNQIRLNGRAVGVGVLRSIMPSLVTIHGQSETGALTEPAAQLELVDLYSSNAELRTRYTEAYNAYVETKEKLSDLLAKRAEGERIRELLAYQIKDIDSLHLHDGEEEELIDKKLKIKNGERLRKHTDFVYKALRGSEKGSVAYLLDRSISSLTQISDVIPECAEYAEAMRDMLYRIEEIAEDVYAASEDTVGDPDVALNEIESRLDKISRLKRKYGLTIKSVLEFRDKCASELDSIDNSEEIEKALRKEEAQRYDAALSIAEELDARRREAAKRLETTVRETLEFLDMPGVVFYASFKDSFIEGKRVLGPTGYAALEFYISANKGAEAMPMARVASGGELARVMLALKSAIADKDGISTVIYDEIDAGVSGKTARKIGIKMLELSKASQLVCVTHSAQIASLADTHILIRKRELDGATQTETRVLDNEGRIAEVSRILGGIDVTKAQRDAAIDMLNEKTTL